MLPCARLTQGHRVHLYVGRHQWQPFFGHPASDPDTLILIYDLIETEVLSLPGQLLEHKIKEQIDCWLTSRQTGDWDMQQTLNLRSSSAFLEYFCVVEIFCLVCM